MIAALLALGALPMQAPQSVVCLGDAATIAYAKPLAASLGSRWTVTTVVKASSAITGDDLSKTLMAKPDVVLLSVGTTAASMPSWPSDRDRFVPDLEGVIERLRAAPTHPKVFLCIPPPSNLPESDVRRHRLADEAVPLMKQAARETDCPTIDFEAALRDRLDLVDGMTPNEEGAEILSDAVTDAIFVGRKADWRIVYADSEEADEGPAKNAIDGDPDTYWHTNYSSTADKYPHEIQVDTGFARMVGGFSYTPRQVGVNGRVAKYEFYVSLDGKNWGEPVAKGQFPSGGEVTRIQFLHPVQCRFFRFRALSEQQGQIWASVGEIDILKFYPKRP